MDYLTEEGNSKSKYVFRLDLVSSVQYVFSFPLSSDQN